MAQPSRGQMIFLSESVSLSLKKALFGVSRHALDF